MPPLHEVLPSRPSEPMAPGVLFRGGMSAREPPGGTGEVPRLSEGKEFHHENGRGKADAGMAAAPEGSPGGGGGRVT